MGRRSSEILTTAFDEVDGRWIWYANAWSRGVVVTSEERDLYTTRRPLAFRRAIRGRPASEPRRPYWPTVKRMLIAMLFGFDPAGAGR